MSECKIPWILERGHEAKAIELLSAYFGPDGKRTAYTGSHFETLGGAWDEGPADLITAGDLIAVSALSVDIPAAASIKILGTEADRITALLKQISRDLELPDASDEIVDAGAPAELWSLLRELPGMGPTTTSKLLARKRPRLVPIYDSVVASVYGIPDSRGYWRAMRTLVKTDNLWQRADQLRVRAGLSPLITPLRVIDIVVWMHGKTNVDRGALTSLTSSSKGANNGGRDSADQ